MTDCNLLHAAVTCCWFLFFTLSDCPWGRGSHVPQADVRGASPHLPSDSWPHRVRCYWCCWSFLQVLRQRHHRADQVWQVRLKEDTRPVNLHRNVLSHYTYILHRQQRSRCIILSLCSLPNVSLRLTWRVPTFTALTICAPHVTFSDVNPDIFWVNYNSLFIPFGSSSSQQATEDAPLSAGWIS